MRNLLKAVVVVLLFSSSYSCFAEHTMLAYISLDDATKQIIDGTYNKVLGAQTEVVDGKEVHVIKVLTPDGRIQYFKIDAQTGQLIS
jgi:Peptidase propeptide and YPEB domain.